MILRKGSIPDQAPLNKAMDDYHLLFSLRPSEQLFLLFLNQLHLIWEGGPVSVLKVVPEKERLNGFRSEISRLSPS